VQSGPLAPEGAHREPPREGAILLVEDEPAIRESLAYLFSRSGFPTLEAENVKEALRLLDAGSRISLLLLDLMLPDGSGFDLLEEVRRRGLRLPVIVLSSRDEETDRVRALESGADDYVTKPFSPREVVARVRAVLRRATPRIPEPTRGLCLDEERRRATCEGRELELTRVEFGLLSLLCGQPRIVTKRQVIKDRVWGSGFALSDRTIDSHIKALRRKLGDAGGDPAWIETVRGVGYRLTEAESP